MPSSSEGAETPFFIWRLHVVRDQARGALGDFGVGLGDFLGIGQGVVFVRGHGDSLG